MHADFSEWYRQAGLEPNGEDLPKRWSAIQQYSPKKEEIVSLVEVFNRLGKTKDSFPPEFLKALQAADPPFKTRDNDQEFAVLAGAELVDVIERAKPNRSILAALSLVCSAAANMRPTPPVRDIPEIAAKQLGRASAKRVSWNDTGDDENPDGPFKILAGLGEDSKPLIAALRGIQRDLAIVTEEANMLWWLFSEHSRDAEKRWSDFKFAAVPLMAGKELADLTLLIPGPVSTGAFLDRVTRSAKAKPPDTVSVSEAINSTSLSWREQYLAKYYVTALEKLSPITFGIKASTASSQSDAWLPVFTEGTQIAADVKIGPYILAYQLFLEALLARCWKE